MTISINIKAKKRMEPIKLLAVCVGWGVIFIDATSQIKFNPSWVSSTNNGHTKNTNGVTEENREEDGKVSAFPAE